MKAIKVVFVALMIVAIWGLWWWFRLPLAFAIVSTFIVILALGSQEYLGWVRGLQVPAGLMRGHSCPR